MPIKAPVAGIAMGLISDGSNYTVLTDIQGLEDHFGDMDFKVAGTRDGITALQMDSTDPRDYCGNLDGGSCPSQESSL